ncbi:SHOCT domain-containing protein [Enterococcus faecalis]|uniref:SHOCT domain-containing protein n=1 Tax=Enterococcus faecalis TaxID=1351 RepID=UPI003CC5C44D
MKLLYALSGFISLAGLALTFVTYLMFIIKKRKNTEIFKWLFLLFLGLLLIAFELIIPGIVVIVYPSYKIFCQITKYLSSQKSNNDNTKTSTNVPEPNKKKESKEFTETGSYGPLKIDDTRKLFKYKSEIFNYTDLISFELIEDGNQVTHGGISLGRAALGGILFGTSGAAITGASKIKKEDKNYCSQLDIMIHVKNSPKPTKFIKLITFKIDKSKFMYKQMANTAKEILGGLNYILDNIETQTSSDNAIDQFDNLKKLKELLDMGILSQEEFDKKKQKLLDL